MAISSSIQSTSVDPRVEFWSDQSKWPRNCSTHVFLGWVILDLGSIVHRTWTGKEPSTAVVYPIWPTLDANTPQADIRRAVDVLFYTHEGYGRRAEAALDAGNAMPMPTPDEWAVASGWWRQVADEAQASYNRFSGVVDILVSIFELNFVATAVRGNLAGEMRPIPHGWWINECFEDWFATCQIDPNFPFMRSPVRFGGDWIYVDRDSYLAWRDSAFRSLIVDRERGPQNSQASVQTDGGSTEKEEPCSPVDAGAEPENCSTCSNTSPCDEAVDNSQLDLFPGGEAEDSSNTLTTSPITASPEAIDGDCGAEPSAPVNTSFDGQTTQLPLAIELSDTEHLPTVEPTMPVAEVAKPAKQRRKQQRAGNKPTYDWPPFAEEVVRRACAIPKPRSGRALAGQMLSWCNEVWGFEPSESRVRTKIAETLAAYNITLN